jgi:hypothetical protein
MDREKWCYGVNPGDIWGDTLGRGCKLRPRAVGVTTKGDILRILHKDHEEPMFHEGK